MNPFIVRVSISFAVLVCLVFYMILFSNTNDIQIENYDTRVVYFRSPSNCDSEPLRGELGFPSIPEDVGSLSAELRSAINVYVRSEELEQDEDQVFELNKNDLSDYDESDNSSCTRRPHAYELQFSNKYWQVQRIESEYNSSTVFIYNAFLDIRETEPYVRVLLVTDRFYYDWVPYPKYLQLWYEDEEKFRTVEVANVDSVFRWWTVGVRGNYHPFLLSFPLPLEDGSSLQEEDIPVSVSLVKEECDLATNDVKLIFNWVERREKQDFGICFKWIDFPTLDMSKRLIELIELLKILGVNGVHFPVMWSNNKTNEVLKYYVNEGYVTTKPFTLPGNQYQFPLNGHSYLKHNSETKIRQELVPYMDCFLTNMYKYRYIGVLDIDEVVIPAKRAISYKEFFQQLERRHSKSLPTSFCFDMKLFTDKMLFPNNSVMAEANVDKIYNEDDPYFTTKVNYDKPVFCSFGRDRNFKCFHNTERVLIVSNHRPTLCFNNHWNGTEECVPKGGGFQRIKMYLGYTHHHKDTARSCAYGKRNRKSQPFGRDEDILRYKAEVIQNRDLILNRMKTGNLSANPENSF